MHRPDTAEEQNGDQNTSEKTQKQRKKKSLGGKRMFKKCGTTSKMCKHSPSCMEDTVRDDQWTHEAMGIVVL